MSKWTSILDDLTTYLRWRQECHERTDEVAPDIFKCFLSDTPGKTAVGKPMVAAAGPSTAKAPVRQRVEILSPPVETEPVRAGDREAASLADTPDARLTALAVIAQKVAACRQCVLCEKRKQTVPGQGNAMSPDLMFIGEAPGADEDEQGLAFVGAAGQLLTKMIAAMGYTRDEVFITNICKCQPPNNRLLAPEEMQACLPYLRSQIAVIRPRVIIALGAMAVKGLLDASAGISKMRGIWTSYAGIPLMPTYHPVYLLRLPQVKKDAWEDLKKVLAKLGRPVPSKKS